MYNERLHGIAQVGALYVLKEALTGISTVNTYWV